MKGHDGRCSRAVLGGGILVLRVAAPGSWWGGLVMVMVMVVRRWKRRCRRSIAGSGYRMQR